MIRETQLIDKDSYIVEGYQVTPELVDEIIKKFGKEKIRAIFLVKHDETKFIEDIHKSSTPNDWIIRKTKEFLGLEPTNIIQQWDKYLITFTLQEYNMAAVIDIEKNYKLYPLAIDIKGQVIAIPDFALTLIPFSQGNITRFVNDPLDYIQDIDPKAYDKVKAIIDSEKK